MEEKEKTSLDKELQLRVQPCFKFGYTIIPLLMIYSIYSIVFLMLSVMLGMVFSKLVGLIIFLVFISVLASILGVQTVLNIKKYKNMYYDFYKTKIIYRYNFLDIIEKEFNYKDIKQIVMRQTFIQRCFNIGNIIIFTNAETGHGGGIAIKNIENVKDIYKHIKTIIEI